MKLTFSIITVTLNDKTGLLKTVNSIQDQTTKDYEHIIIDGNSRYNINEIVTKEVNNLNIISEKDDGLYDAMNKGIKLAKGEYIMFINSGDILFSNDTLNMIAKQISSHNPELIYGDAIEINENETTQYYKKARSYKGIWYGIFTYHQAILYKLDVVVSNNLTYDLQYKIGADYAFTANFIKYIKKIKYINKPLCIFRQGGVSAIQYNAGLKDNWKIRKDIFEYCYLKRLGIHAINRFMLFIRHNLFNLYKIIRFKEK